MRKWGIHGHTPFTYGNLEGNRMINQEILGYPGALGYPMFRETHVPCNTFEFHHLDWHEELVPLSANEKTGRMVRGSESSWWLLTWPLEAFKETFPDWGRCLSCEEASRQPCRNIHVGKNGSSPKRGFTCAHEPAEVGKWNTTTELTKRRLTSFLHFRPRFAGRMSRKSPLLSRISIDLQSSGQILFLRHLKNLDPE